MALKAHGVDEIGRLIAQNVAQIRHLAALVDAHPDLERLAPVPLNICCFRFAARGLAEPELNAVNQEILWRLQESGVAMPSHTMLNGKFAIRAANTNQRTQRADFDLLVATVVKIGHQVLAERSTGTRTAEAS